MRGPASSAADDLTDVGRLVRRARESGLDHGPGFLGRIETRLVALALAALLLVATSLVVLIVFGARGVHSQLGLIVGLHLGAGLLMSALLGMALSMAQSTSARIRQLREVATELGVGDLSVRAPTEPLDDYGQLGLALNVMADRLGRLLQAQRDLLAGVSHELRSPLARIEVAVELTRSELRTLAEKGGDPSEAALLLDSVVEEVELLEQHIARLLEAQRVSAEGSLPRRSEVIVDEMIHKVLRREARRLDRLGWKVDVQLDLPGVRLMGDGNALDRVVSTLIENAVQHAGEGVAADGRVATRELTVQTERDPEDRAVIRVMDRGPGLTPEQCGRVFEAFFRTDRSRSTNTGGTGLGLYLVKRITEAHGGSARAVPRAGGGLIIELWLPMLGGVRESKETIRMSVGES